MADRFATTQTVVKTLADGETVEFKVELSYFEERKLAGGGALRQAGQDDEGNPLYRLDFAEAQVDRLVTWLVDWSFTRVAASGKKEAVPLTRAAIAALTPVAGAELDALLDAHIAEQKAKNAPAATPTTPLTATS